MRAAELRPRGDDIIVGIDLAAREHQAVIVDADGRRLTRFRVPHPREGIGELLRRSRPRSWQAADRLFAFEATGHVWGALRSGATEEPLAPAALRVLPRAARGVEPRRPASACYHALVNHQVARGTLVYTAHLGAPQAATLARSADAHEKLARGQRGDLRRRETGLLAVLRCRNSQPTISRSWQSMIAARWPQPSAPQ